MSLFTDRSQSFETLRSTFTWSIPQRYNIARDVCDRHVDRMDEIALFLEDEQGNESRYRFGDLKGLSNQLANGLKTLGVKPGDRVGIILPQRVETLLAHLAIYKLGAVALPLSQLFRRDALEYRLCDSGASVVITDDGHVGVIGELRDQLPELHTVINCDGNDGGRSLWQLLERGSDTLAMVNTSRSQAALLIYTSGTTGPPKGALSAHRCLLGNLPGFELSHNFFPEPGDLMWTPADWAWTGGLLDGLLPALHYGVPVLGYAGGKFDPDHAFYLMAKYGVRNAFIPPTAMKMLMQVPDGPGRDGFKLRSIMSAGEQVGPEVLSYARHTMAVELNEMWGQTEFNYIAGSCAAIMETRPGSMGKAYPGHKVAVIDDHGEPLPAGEMGELAAYSQDPVMFLGYWKRPDAAMDKISNGWFRTGDLGYMDEDGYLWFMGRSDDVINSAGHRIGPGEIEDCLIKHPAVAQAAVIGSPDQLRGEIVKAYIVLSAGHTASDELAGEIQTSVKQRLAAHEYPRIVEFMDELPLTTTGKIRRMELRAKDRQQREEN